MGSKRKLAVSLGNSQVLFMISLKLYVYISDDDWIVSHDASRFVIYYHCVRDVISDEAMLSHLILRGFCLSTELVYIPHCVCSGGFCCCSKGFSSCFVGLSRNTYKLRGKHGRTKKNCRLFVVNLPVVKLFAGAGKKPGTDNFFFWWPKHLRK